MTHSLCCISTRYELAAGVAEGEQDVHGGAQGRMGTALPQPSVSLPQHTAMCLSTAAASLQFR